MRQVILYPGEIGYWVAECPRLPRCISQRKTNEDTIQDIPEVIESSILPPHDHALAPPGIVFVCRIWHTSDRTFHRHLERRSLDDSALGLSGRCAPGQGT